jgi:predicted transcriptional regulator of viral defense system
VEELIKKYNYNEPIILKDVEIEGISYDNIRQIFSRLVTIGKTERYDQGVYYIPKVTPLGKSRTPARKCMIKSLFLTKMVLLVSIPDLLSKMQLV